jgi:hypothetical protein
MYDVLNYDINSAVSYRKLILSLNQTPRHENLWRTVDIDSFSLTSPVRDYDKDRTTKESGIESWCWYEMFNLSTALRLVEMTVL